jgi:hypothetical protein
MSVNTLTLRVLRDPTMVLVQVKETARVARKHAKAVASFDGAGRAPMALGMRGVYAAESPRHTSWSFPASVTKPAGHCMVGEPIVVPDRRAVERIGEYRDLHGGVGRFLVHRREPVRSVAFTRKPRYVKLYCGLTTRTRTRISPVTAHEPTPEALPLARDTRTQYRKAVKLGVLREYHVVTSVARA